MSHPSQLGHTVALEEIGCIDYLELSCSNAVLMAVIYLYFPKTKDESPFGKWHEWRRSLQSHTCRSGLDVSGEVQTGEAMGRERNSPRHRLDIVPCRGPRQGSDGAMQQRGLCLSSLTQVGVTVYHRGTVPSMRYYFKQPGEVAHFHNPLTTASMRPGPMYPNHVAGLSRRPGWAPLRVTPDCRWPRHSSGYIRELTSCNCVSVRSRAYEPCTSIPRVVACQTNRICGQLETSLPSKNGGRYTRCFDQPQGSGRQPS